MLSSTPASPPGSSPKLVDALEAPLLPPIPHPFADYRQKFYDTDAALVVDLGMEPRKGLNPQ
ncbi:hypothetical protein L0F63_007077 [Massospora cicadina]|nr:hypothetical protein L0F63_007077 [Massospora cicadina]